MAIEFNVDSQVRPYANVGAFPATGSVKTLYIDESTSDLYYWDGSAYAIVKSQSKYEAIDAINGTGATVLKMSVCYLKTSSSSANTPELLLSNASTEATSSKTIGLLLQDLTNGATGKIITSGEYDKFDTSAYNVGDRLWLSTTDGQVTTTIPSAPTHAVFIGFVTRKQSQNGRILVSIQNGYELREIHDVSLPTTPLDGQVLAYDSPTSLWKAKTISTGITIGTTAITSGTVGRVLFEGTGNVVQESANLFWDNTNGRLGIGGTPGAYSLDVYGNTRVQNTLTVNKGGNNAFIFEASANGTAPFIQAFFAGGFDLRLNVSNATNIGGYNVANGLTFYNNTITSNAGIVAGSIGATNGLIAVTGSNANVHIASTAGTSSILSFRETGAANRGVLGYQNGTTYMQIRTNSATDFTNGTLSTVFFSDGNVGINTTTNAGFKLDVNGTARFTGAVTGPDGSSFNGIVFDGGGTRRIRPTANSLDLTDSTGTGGFRVDPSGVRIALGFSSVDFVKGLNSMIHTLGATQTMTFTLNGQFVNHLTPFVDIVAAGYAPSAPSGNNTTLRIYTTNTTSGVYGNIILSHNGTSKTGNILVGTSTNVASAIVNVQSTTQGFLLPRMTTAQKNAIASPVAGLQVYDTTLNLMSYYNGTIWI